MFVVFAAAYTYTKSTQTTVHRSSAIMLVQESRSGAVPGLGDLQTSQGLARTYQQLVTTRPLLERVISELGLTEDVDSLRDQISVSVISGTPLLEVKVTRSDPDSPIDIANTLTQIFIVDRQSTRLAEIARLEALANAQGTTNTSALAEAQLSTLGSLSVVEEARISTPTIRPSLRTNLVLAAFLGAFLSRIHRWTGMDGVRTAEGGEGVTGAMIRARIWVDGRLAGGLQALLGAPMAAYSGCGERDGGIGHGKRRSRTGLAREVAGTLGWLVGQWRTGAVRLGVEWLAVRPGRG